MITLNVKKKKQKMGKGGNRRCLLTHLRGRKVATVCDRWERT